MSFKLWLISIGIVPDQYLSIVSNKAYEYDYNGQILFSDNVKYKLIYRNNVNPDIYFGVNYTYDNVINEILCKKYLLSYSEKIKINSEWVNCNIMTLKSSSDKYENIIVEYYLLWD